MSKKALLTITTLVFAAGCAPQAELVKLRNEMNDLRTETRSEIKDLKGIEKRQDQLAADVKSTSDLQRSIADQGAQFDQLVTDLQIMQGKLEENNFRMKEMSQKLDDKAYRLSELTARVDQLESKLKSAPSGTPVPDKKTEAKTLGPSEAYQQAKTDYDKGNFDLAIAGFGNYLKQFPDASQADSAQYWIGESYYSKKEYGKAIEEFSKVLKDHPKSEKAPGARLKIGYSYLNERNNAKAKEHLNRVIKDYPASKEAALAKEKLKKIGK
ncbi:MAG: tol-pal system protein YbgF [Nitrospirae bacterium]|nr:tol-pal system protein YbgF [Nitrospirota bacterium]